MNEIRKANVSRTGQKVTVEIPADLAFDSTDLTIRRDGDRVILEERRPRLSLLDALQQMEPLSDDEKLVIDNTDLGPLRDIEL